MENYWYTMRDYWQALWESIALKHYWSTIENFRYTLRNYWYTIENYWYSIENHSYTIGNYCHWQVPLHTNHLESRVTSRNHRHRLFPQGWTLASFCQPLVIFTQLSDSSREPFTSAWRRPERQNVAWPSFNIPSNAESSLLALKAIFSFSSMWNTIVSTSGQRPPPGIYRTHRISGRSASRPLLILPYALLSRALTEKQK